MTDAADIRTFRRFQNVLKDLRAAKHKSDITEALRWLESTADAAGYTRGYDVGVAEAQAASMPGTLFWSLTVSMITALAGRDPATDMESYTTQVATPANYVRNASCWLTVCDTGHRSTSIGVWNSYRGTKYNATLITPQHAVADASHVSLRVGDTCRWVGYDNTVVERALAAKVQVGMMHVWRLSAPIVYEVDKVRPARIMPADLSSYLPTVVDYKYPAVRTNQTRQIGVASAGLYYAGAMMGFLTPPEGVDVAWGYSVISGDSGSPYFLLLNGEPILVELIGTGAVFSATAAIAAAVAALGGDYSLELVDLSSYTTF